MNTKIQRLDMLPLGDYVSPEFMREYVIQQCISSAATMTGNPGSLEYGRAQAVLDMALAFRIQHEVINELSNALGGGTSRKLS